MKESYRSPRIKIRHINTEDVLAGSSFGINNEVGNINQLSKETDFDSDEDESQEDSPTYNVW
jgi:hypothetical protein